MIFQDPNDKQYKLNTQSNYNHYLVISLENAYPVAHRLQPKQCVIILNKLNSSSSFLTYNIF